MYFTRGAEIKDIKADVIGILPTWDYITFYKIKKSATLKIRLDYVFSIYGIFLGAIILRYAWEAYQHIHPKHWEKLQEQHFKQTEDKA